MSSVAQATERYLRTGDYEHDHPEWPGKTLWEKAKNGHRDLLRALMAEVGARSASRHHHPVPALDLTSWTRRKLTPMVSGLFPQAEQEAVLMVLEKSVVFLTSANIAGVLLEQHWLRSAWDIANLYLGSLDAPLLGPEAPRILGLSEGTTCYVSTEYFAGRSGISDYVVHEAAHVFHNCKRKTVGLRETRSREWLLDIEFRKRETFAYACEGYGAILERAKDRPRRLALAQEFGNQAARYDTDEFDPADLASIVQGACEARNGWKIIHARCAPVRRPRGAHAVETNEVVVE